MLDVLMTELVHQLMLGTPMIIAPHLKGGIPQYDIVDGERAEVGRIHAMKVSFSGKEQLLVSEELYAKIEKGDSNDTERD